MQDRESPPRRASWTIVRVVTFSLRVPRWAGLLWPVSFFPAPGSVPVTSFTDAAPGRLEGGGSWQLAPVITASLRICWPLTGRSRGGRPALPRYTRRWRWPRRRRQAAPAGSRPTRGTRWREPGSRMFKDTGARPGGSQVFREQRISLDLAATAQVVVQRPSRRPDDLDRTREMRHVRALPVRAGPHIHAGCPTPLLRRCCRI